MLSGALAENEIMFQMDQVFMSDTEGTIHYNLYVPESYDGTVPYALYMALPGWGGLYFQGVGSDLREPFPFAGPMYNARMIVVSPQLNDWGVTSARQTIALTEYMIARMPLTRLGFISAAIPAVGKRFPWCWGCGLSCTPARCTSAPSGTGS